MSRYQVIPWQLSELQAEYVELPDGYTFAAAISAGVVALVPDTTPPPSDEPDPAPQPAPAPGE